MEVTLDPPAAAGTAEAPPGPKKRGGGPRTLAGRMRSRENSVKSSLRSKVIFSKDMARRILDRNTTLDEEFNPKTRYELMLVADMALAKARADRSAELQTENDNRYIDRTVDHWEQDQHERAQKLWKRIGKDPGLIACKLMGFKQGVELMISAWQELAAAVRETGDWDDAQRRLSLDLRGLHLVLRVGNTLLAGKVTPETMAATAAREIARLQSILDEWLDQQDEYDQDDALTGLVAEDDPTAKRLKRYERLALRDYDKALAELKRAKADRQAASSTGYAKSTLRAWDVDALIARIQTIHNPPGLLIEKAEALTPARRPAAAPSPAPAAAAPAPAAIVVVEAAPSAGPIETPSESEVAIESLDDIIAADLLAADSPDHVADADDPMDAIVETKAPLSRRARKLLQKRLREAARRDAQKNDA